MEQVKYQCICGRTFEKANAFNGHKSHCLVHQQNKNNLDNFRNDEKARHSKTKNTLQLKASQAAELNRITAENNLLI